MTPSIERLRRDAKALKRAFAAGEGEAVARVRAVLPEADAVKHADALHVIAVEQGHESWSKLKFAAEAAAMDRAALRERLKMALYFGQGWVIDRIMAADPDLAVGQFHLEVALYDRAAVEARLARDPEAALREVGPRRPILHLAFSRYLQLRPELKSDMIAIAELLVSHGADVNDGYPAEPGSPHLLSALYGALGHADNMALAEWLLDRGATPDDNESLYHATELGHLDGVRLLLDHGVTIEGTNALPRMLDFNNVEGARMLLEAGAKPNENIAGHPSGEPPLVTSSLHHAARRMCSAEIAELLISYGADGSAGTRTHSAYALARLRGNAPFARVLEEAGQAPPLNATEALLAKAAEGEVDGKVDPAELTEETRRLIGRILGFDINLDHVKRLVALGLDPDEPDEMGLPAIHIAGWEGHADAVEWLLTLDPDLTRKNDYGGDLMGTIIHGAEFSPARASRDHLRCAALVLEAGAPLHRGDIDGTGVEAMAAFLEEWAEAHPERVVPRG